MIYLLNNLTHKEQESFEKQNTKRICKYYNQIYQSINNGHRWWRMAALTLNISKGDHNSELAHRDEGEAVGAKSCKAHAKTSFSKSSASSCSSPSNLKLNTSSAHASCKRAWRSCANWNWVILLSNSLAIKEPLNICKYCGTCGYNSKLRISR